MLHLEFHLFCKALVQCGGMSEMEPGSQREDSKEGGAAAFHEGQLDHFEESKELLSLVKALPTVYNELRNRELSEERFTCE